MRRLFLCAAVLFLIAPLRAQQVNPSVFAELRWRSIGPDRSGYVSAPAGIPGDPTTYYIGLPEGGVWKTTNAGTTWKPIFDEARVASIGAVAVAPSDPTIVYVGTGNQSGWSFTIGKGIYKSTDAGRTWANVGLPRSQYINAVAVDPRDPNKVLVAALGPRPVAGAPPPAGGGTGDERGVFRSINGGRSWTRVLPADAPAPASDVYVDYADPQIAFALLSTFAAPGAAQPPVTNSGLFASHDGGATWQATAGRGLPDGARISAFAVSGGTRGRRVYALAAVGGGRGAGGAGTRGLYRSDDGGETWTLGTRQLASGGGKIYADPQNPDVMYVMGTAIYRSTDGAKSVAAYWGAPSGADPRFLWIDPTNARRMISGVDQGVAISVDAGESWTPYYGLVNGQFYRVSTDYDFPYHVCGPQQDSGTACVRSRSDFGEIRPNDWYTPAGFENGFLIADPTDKRYMYSQGWYHVLRRFDRTTNQVVVLYQPAPDERFGGAPPLAFSPHDPKTMYMAAQHVLVSNDRGITWRPISGDLAAPPGTALPAPPAPGAGGVGAPAPGGSIQSMALSLVAADVIWVGASTGLVHVTRDGGKTWTNVTPPKLPPGGINIIDASRAGAGTAHVALLSRDAHPHIYRTTDFGQSWDEIAGGLADGEVVRVVREDPVDRNLLYAGTVTSVYVSFDRGDHWQSLQLNLPTTVVSDLTVHDADIAVSTYGRGFWILDDIAPLRQARAAMTSQAPYLFKVEPASRARWDNTQDTPLPPEMVVGENPPEGAIIDYYLPGEARTLSLAISDASGGRIREYSSVAPPIDPTMANVPGYWLATPVVLPTTAGMHRVAWDLRYADPPTLNYGYSGTRLDYREYTLSWHAIPGKTPRSTLVGPMVLPGRYTATLTVDGRSYTQPVTVVQDPRVTVSESALAAQLKLQQRMVAGLRVTHDAMQYLLAVDAAVAGDAGGASSGIDPKQREALAAALAPLETGPAGFGIAHRDLGRRLNDQLVADQEPTPSVIAGVDRPCDAIDASLDRLRAVQATTIAEIGASRARQGLKPLPAWTPPAAPACGAR